MIDFIAGGAFEGAKTIATNYDSIFDEAQSRRLPKNSKLWNVPIVKPFLVPESSDEDSQPTEAARYSTKNIRLFKFFQKIIT